MHIANRLIGILTVAVLLPILANCSRQTITGTNTIVWDSTELQSQIGTKNSNKKKLVMRVWHEVSELQSDGTYHWFVKYNVKAEDHNLTNSGWHYAPDLATFTFNATVQVPGSWTSPISITANLTGLQTHSDFVAYVSTAKPIFLSKTATATRSGGNSGISVVW